MGRYWPRSSLRFTRRDHVAASIHATAYRAHRPVSPSVAASRWLWLARRYRSMTLQPTRHAPRQARTRRRTTGRAASAGRGRKVAALRMASSDGFRRHDHCRPSRSRAALGMSRSTRAVPCVRTVPCVRVASIRAGASGVKGRASPGGPRGGGRFSPLPGRRCHSHPGPTLPSPATTRR